MSRAQKTAGTTFISKKPFSQWDGLMRNYYKKNEEKCKFAETPVDEVLDQHEVKHYPTGSSYNGAVDVLGMNGYGEYTYPNGVVYRGDFREGRFHGNGELVYNNGPEADSIIQGQWVNGVLTEQKILLNGNLEYDTHDWKYCLLDDRRYAVELETDLRLPGKSLITPEQPPRTIPPGYYDTVDGFYNPKTKMVYNNDTTMEVKRFTLPCKCQWLCDMKAFRQKMEEKCRTTEVPEFSKRSEEFCTGSTYEGEWRKGCGMHGYGEYTFNNGVVYEGEFRDGTMHGTGELRYKIPYGTAAVRGQWKNGKMTDRTVIFDDALDYDEDDWQYCKMPDRRFTVEYANGLRPGGKSYQTPNLPTLKVPVGYCDTEDGFYDCKRKVVVQHEDATKLVRGPSCLERRWIVDNCRVGQENLNVGPRPDLYEKYVEPTQRLESAPAPAVHTRFKLKSEYSEIFESELQKTIDNVKANTVAAVPTELLLT